MPSSLKNKLIDKDILQDRYNDTLEYLDSQEAGNYSSYELDLKSIKNTLGNSYTPEQLIKFVFNSDEPINKKVWLRDKVKGTNTCGLCINGLTGQIELQGLSNNSVSIAPIINLDLYGINFEKLE